MLQNLESVRFQPDVSDDVEVKLLSTHASMHIETRKNRIDIAASTMLERASKLQEAPTLLVTQKAISPGGFVKIQTVQHLEALSCLHRSSSIDQVLIVTPLSTSTRR